MHLIYTVIFSTRGSTVSTVIAVARVGPRLVWIPHLVPSPARLHGGHGDEVISLAIRCLAMHEANSSMRPTTSVPQPRPRIQRSSDLRFSEKPPAVHTISVKNGLTDEIGDQLKNTE